MYKRLINPPIKKSFFLLGPRGTGKTTWLRQYFPKAIYIDLLRSQKYTELLAQPQRLETFIPPEYRGWVVIDEVQRVPALLFEVHRLIEERRISFVLTGSSARKLKQRDVNLLAGRALTYHCYPLSVAELGRDFNLQHALMYGHLPATFQEGYPQKYLASYVETYLREEVQQEGLTRNLGAFSRFLEVASFSQGQVLTMAGVAREAAVHQKVAENYFTILEDLLIAERLPVFTKRAKRRSTAHPKFYFFDVGVYRAIRPKGPLDSPEEIGGIALETLVYQELKAINAYSDLGYKLYYWRTAENSAREVDFVLYGERGIVAVEVKTSKRIQPQHLRGLQSFIADYPQTRKSYLVYGGTERRYEGKIQCIPITDFLQHLKSFL